MTVLRNNFDGGPDGTTITIANSGQVPGNDPFDGVYSTGCICQYTSAFGRPTAEFVGRFDTSGVAQSPCVYWTTSMGAQGQIWTRFYGYYDASPNISTSPVLFGIIGGGGTYGCLYLGLLVTTGQLYYTDSLRTVSIPVTTNAIPVQNWFRVELRAEFSATTGNADIRYYEDADTEDATDVLSVSSQNLGGPTADQFLYGYSFKVANLTDLYLSNLELNNTGWPGPAPYKVKGVPGIQPSPVAIHNW